MKATERLEAILDDKDAEIERLQEQLNEANEAAKRWQAEANWVWTKHREFKSDPSPDLPVPRLEIRWLDEEHPADGYTVRAEYSLVFRHLLGHVVYVPLGMTRSTGALASRTQWGDVQLPFRDGAHLANEARQLKLPAFAIAGDKVARFDPCVKCGRFERWHRNGVDCAGYAPQSPGGDDTGGGT